MNELLTVQDLVVDFEVHHGGEQPLRAVDHVSFAVRESEVLALVGESGAGKSTTARAIPRLIEPLSGGIWLDGEDVVSASRSRLRELRRHMPVVFQDPYASLNPYMAVEDIVAEGLDIHRLARTRRERRERVVEVLELVGLSSEHLRRRPAAFSGGERQRIAIARAIAVKPRLLICDEPVTALDASVRAQVLNLFAGLQRQLEIGLLFVTHDLATVRYLADRVAVMQSGRIVEEATTDEIFAAAKDPYTQSLLIASPVADPVIERERRAARRALEPGRVSANS
jgi:oligopeptide transport system ATP-binding protein